MNNLQTLSLDSREVAKMLEKDHKHLLRDISVYAEYLIQSKVGLNEFFQAATYKDKIGRTLRSYKITKKGCEFLAHKQTGRKGAIFTASYIRRFHEMEAKLKQLPKQQTLIEEPYKPTLKYYRGIPVITKRDLAVVLNTGVFNLVPYWSKKGLLIKSRDYFLLAGEDLELFKKDNPGCTSAMTASLIVITASGARKICKVRNREESCKSIFITENPKPIPVEPVKSIWVKKMVVDAPKNEQVKKAIEKIRKQMTALDVLLTEYYAYNTEALHNGLKETLEQVGMNVNHEVFGLTRIKLNIIESKW